MLETTNTTEQKSNIIRMILQLGDPVGKSFEQICSVIGESDKSYLGDPLRCSPNSLSHVWHFEDSAVTMYFDTDEICFGADYDHVILPFGEKPRSESEMLNLLRNFI